MGDLFLSRAICDIIRGPYKMINLKRRFLCPTCRNNHDVITAMYVLYSSLNVLYHYNLLRVAKYIVVMPNLCSYEKKAHIALTGHLK